MAETLSMISIISFVAAAICLAVTIVFFIRFKIPSVIGDLSGRNARKSIEQMRAINEKSGKKSYNPSKVNLERGKLTETMQGTKKSFDKTQKNDERPESGLLDENKVGLLKESETVLLKEVDATELLQDENFTVALDEEASAKKVGGVPIELLEEVMLVHTDEVIR